VLVIGAGPGGYVAAIRAGQRGKDVTLVERDAYGGVCLNRGCIPSKALVNVADLAHRTRNADHMGLDATVDVDFERLQSWQDEVVKRLTGGVEQLCRSAGVRLVEGTAVFESSNEVEVVDSGPDAPEHIRFDNAVLATGSRPMTIPGFEPDGEIILTSANVFSLDERPDSLVVIGGGYIGMELATVFAKLGTDVTVIEMLDQPMPMFESDLVKVVTDAVEAMGVDVRTNEAAEGLERTDNGAVVTTDGEDGESRFEADRVLVAVGREPVTDTLGLAGTDVQVTDNGFIKTDRRGETTDTDIYAIGDVAGEPMLAHKASRQGEIVADYLAGEQVAFDYRTIPAAVFTSPEIATVGLTEAEAEAEGCDPIVGQFAFEASGRALTRGDASGFVRIVADADTEFLLGGQIVGPEASELIAELGIALEMGAHVEDVAATVFTHPTLSESVMEAAADLRGEAIHAPSR
jgi:dihydrolipoamide dehydrogenase